MAFSLSLVAQQQLQMSQRRRRFHQFIVSISFPSQKTLTPADSFRLGRLFFFLCPFFFGGTSTSDSDYMYKHKPQSDGISRV